MNKTTIFATLVLILGYSFRVQAQDLASHVDVNVSSSIWSYTLFDDEPLGNANYINSFSLAIAAPISNISAPDGWAYSSDNSSYVFWYNADPSLPLPHDVAPGASLGGFSIESASAVSQPSDFVIQAWDHTANMPGLVNASTVLAPASPVPEASTVVSLGVGLLVLSGIALIARKRARKTAS